MIEVIPGIDDVPVDVSVARKLLDEPLAVQQVDLPDFFPVLSPQIDQEALEECYDS
ncbi:MAG: hypothetical protein ACK2UQ_12960 [Anaerolineae bacterium]